MNTADPKYWDFYKRYRRRMQTFGASKGPANRVREILLLGPDLLHLTLHLLADPDVPTHLKVKLGAAVAYFISPIDLLPELVFGPFGYLDDIALLGYVLNGLLNEVPEEVPNRYWAGDQQLFIVVRAVVMAADRMLGKGIWTRLKNQFSGSKHTPVIEE